MTDTQQPTESHSKLFGLEGQKRASTTAGSGAGTGITGTSGHAGSLNNKAPDARVEASEKTVAGVPHGGRSGTKPGSGGEPLYPSQRTGTIGKDA
ncbi:hypothetical protein PV08_04259 [Exophiala spinifera]|uniref:Uncharacterized protein n=1 Tax=Exophiala spinifera TaxID=91928 RepID=A0A0D2BDQ1_9EURO|nr:uncharacterized protein PV08_04259 [Exophiala spinifera]KIW17068.1 hypothetical protein PV08_04259 [Exophiala spinifera]